jgi:hypothetical protein
MTDWLTHFFFVYAATEEQMKPVLQQAEAFKKYAPDFKGHVPPPVSVKKLLVTIGKASLEEGYGAQFISHKGRGEKWL